MRRLTEKDFWARVQRGSQDSCWPWLGSRMKHGYGTVTIGGVCTTAHRFAYMFAKGNIPERLEVLHRCDNRPCCNPDHLFLGTQKDNIADMIAKGRQNTGIRPKGEAHGMHKLTDEQVVKIRQRYKSGETQMQLATSFKTCQSHISRIIRGENRD